MMALTSRREAGEVVEIVDSGGGRNYVWHYLSPRRWSALPGARCLFRQTTGPISSLEEVGPCRQAVI
jgi:hypothetical protein